MVCRLKSLKNSLINVRISSLAHKNKNHNKRPIISPSDRAFFWFVSFLISKTKDYLVFLIVVFSYFALLAIFYTYPQSNRPRAWALPNFTTLFFRLRSVRRFRVDMCIKSVYISLPTNPTKKHQQKPLKTAHFCTLSQNPYVPTA